MSKCFSLANQSAYKGFHPTPIKKLGTNIKKILLESGHPVQPGILRAVPVEKLRFFPVPGFSGKYAGGSGLNGRTGCLFRIF